MDSLDLEKMEEKARKGLPEASETDTYYKAWWSASKGGDRGKLGGVVIGAVLGTLIGTAVAGITAVAAGGIAPLLFATIVAGFAAGGMAYEAHEYNINGKIAGGVSGGLEATEAQIKEYTNVKFAEVNQKLDKLEKMVSGGKSVSKTGNSPHIPASQQVGEEEAIARIEKLHRQTQHCDAHHCGAETRKLMFWNVALIGVLVGVAAGALLAFGGLAGHVFEMLGGAGEALAHHPIGLYAASMATCGLIGASFGINRDLFREVFDTTDRWYKGLIGKGRENGKAPSHAQDTAQTPGSAPSRALPSAATREISPAQPYVVAKSDTHYRDRVMKEARQALLSMDHTTAIRH